VYADDVVTQSELPDSVRAYRLQQYRWIKGTAQNARELLGAVVQSGLPWMSKVHAAGHLLESSLYLAMLGLLMTTAGMGAMGAWEEVGIWPFIHPGVLFGAAGLACVHFVAQRQRIGRRLDLIAFGADWVAFFVLTTGMTIHNGCAVLAGYCQSGGEFTRTPKTGSGPRVDARAEHCSILRWVLAIEGVAWLLLAACLVAAARHGRVLLLWLPLVTMAGLTTLILGSTFTHVASGGVTLALRRVARRDSAP
jgi:hypothetical protein